jgi:MerR family transcriptional regulator, copper efflux regulator
MKIGELAKATGLSTSAIRFYEQSGLLSAPPRGLNGYRDYSDDAVERLKLVQLAQRLGFSLETLRSGLSRDVDEQKEALLAGLEGRLREVEQLRAALERQQQELHMLREMLQSHWQAGDCLKIDTVTRRMDAATGRDDDKPRRAPAPRGRAARAT